MVHAASRKGRPTPLKDVQVPARSRRYIVLDAHSSLPSPAYPFEQQAVPSTLLSPSLQEEHPTRQVRIPASSAPPTRTSPCVVSHLLDPFLPTPPLVAPGIAISPGMPGHRWNDSLNNQDGDYPDPVSLRSSRLCRPSTPPISPPVSPLPGSDTEHPSKRCGMTFALVPAEIDGKHVFTHVVVDRRGNSSTSNPGFSPGEVGLPEDMQDVLRQLDDLACWVRSASSSRDYGSSLESIVDPTYPAEHSGTGADGDTISHLTGGPFSNKGKSRLLPNCRDLESPGATPVDLTVTDLQSEGYIYVPNCNTPEFLVGSSNSPIAYPVCGYSSHPSHYPPLVLGSMHDISYHRRFLERRSAPCPPPMLVSPPSSKTSFRTLFQRSRCNTTTASRPSISLGRVSVEGALRQGRRMRLPWVKI